MLTGNLYILLEENYSELKIIKETLIESDVDDYECEEIFLELCLFILSKDFVPNNECVKRLIKERLIKNKKLTGLGISYQNPLSWVRETHIT